jgi:hypothetical protein
MNAGLIVVSKDADFTTLLRLIVRSDALLADNGIDWILPIRANLKRPLQRTAFSDTKFSGEPEVAIWCHMGDNGCWSSSMFITLPLTPQEEAKLMAIAQAKGLSADAIVQEALEKILADVSEVSPKKEPTRPSRGILSKYGPAPSAEEIDQNRAEMFANFARD